MHPITWIPPADEVAVRLALARQLRENLRASSARKNYQFTAVQVSTLMLMPNDVLRQFVARTASADVATRQQSRYFIMGGLGAIRDMLRYCEFFLSSWSLPFSSS